MGLKQEIYILICHLPSTYVRSGNLHFIVFDDVCVDMKSFTLNKTFISLKRCRWKLNLIPLGEVGREGQSSLIHQNTNNV